MEWKWDPYIPIFEEKIRTHFYIEKQQILSKFRKFDLKLAKIRQNLQPMSLLHQKVVFVFHFSGTSPYRPLYSRGVFKKIPLGREERVWIWIWINNQHPLLLSITLMGVRVNLDMLLVSVCFLVFL